MRFVQIKDDAVAGLRLKDYGDGKEAHKGLDAYFRFYNTERIHQALNYRTPAEVHWA